MNSIIGTAGHVDHGKTCLIRALTGLETDRLKEEKKRGITIDLGFAYLTLSDGSKAGIVDVPGHEKFIGNMLAGAGGIDLAMLVIAADEGIMPQTREHLDILTLLHIQKGIVVVTKADMVDADWLELAQEEIREGLAGSFLENAPMFCVSSYTGAGIPALREALFAMLAANESQRDRLPFRVPVDRVFTVEGFGTVITGTMIEGTLSEGQELMLYPTRTLTKARNIQVHSTDVPMASAGQRTAINLANIKKTEVSRGDVLAPPNSLSVSRMLDVRLYALADCNRILKNNSQLHFYYGSRELLCKAILLDRDTLEKGESCYAQLRFEEDITLKTGDRFVLRFYSPLETVGGGVVLDPNPSKCKRNDAACLAHFTAKETGKLIERLSAVMSDYGALPCPITEAAIRLGTTAAEILPLCDKLCKKKQLLQVGEGLYLHADELERAAKGAVSLLERYHKENPLKDGLKREELRTRLRPQAELAHTDRLLDFLVTEKKLREKNGSFSALSFRGEISDRQQKLQQEIVEIYRKAGYTPPEPEEIYAKYPRDKGLPALLSKMMADRLLVRLGEKIAMEAGLVDAAYDTFCKLATTPEGVTLADFRNAIGTSRKFALALLEYYDSRKLTRKIGDGRIPLPQKQ